MFLGWLIRIKPPGLPSGLLPSTSPSLEENNGGICHEFSREGEWGELTGPMAQRQPNDPDHPMRVERRFNGPSRVSPFLATGCSISRRIGAGHRSRGRLIPEGTGGRRCAMPDVGSVA